MRKNGASVQLLRTLGIPTRTVRRACQDSGVERPKLRWIVVFFTPSERKAFSTTTSLTICVASGIGSGS